MVNFILNLFGKANDWEVVWKEEGAWEMRTGVFQSCYYVIYYSKSLNSYRLESLGYKPKEHVMNRVAEMRLIKFNKDKSISL